MADSLQPPDAMPADGDPASPGGPATAVDPTPAGDSAPRGDPVPPGDPAPAGEPSAAGDPPAVSDPSATGKSSAVGDPAPTSSEQSPPSPAQSDKTVTPDPEPYTRNAIFSTDMGKRPQRKVPGPPYPPVIVRSDRIAGVVAFAHLWLKRYPMEYLCIFRNCGWSIHDLWDAEDIHLESPSFCQETLDFIGQDNYYRAKDYAIKWSLANPDRLSIIGGDMSEYDPQHPLAIVDKLFVNGEAKSYPRTFLWHVAHIMRASIVEASRTLPVANHSGIVHQELATEARNAAVDPNGPAPTSETTHTKRTMSTFQVARKDSRQSPQVAKVSLTTAEPPMPMPAAHTYMMNQPPSHGPPYVPPYAPLHQGEYQNGTMGHMRMGVPGPQFMPPNMGQQGLYVPKGSRSRQKGPDNYGRSIQSTGWGDNVYRAVSGGMQQHRSGSSSTMPSPHFNPASTAAGQPVGNTFHMMPPFVQGHPIVSPSMSAVQPVHPGMMQQGRMLPQSMPMPAPPPMYPYARYPSDGGPPFAPSGLPMADAANMPYPVDIPVSNTERRRFSARHNGQYHGNGDARYDPYEGPRTSHNGSAVPQSGKKHHQNGQSNHQGRSRKPSMPGNRPEPVPYGPERAGNTYYNGHRNWGFRQPTEDNPAIVEDFEKGCHTHWIGPQNDTVREVYIGDLPSDIQVNEIENLFELKIGVLPVSVTLKFYGSVAYRHSSRRQAFVTFAESSHAKQAIGITEPKLRESSISITVPRRLYQRACTSPPVNAIDTTMRNVHTRNGGRADIQVAQANTNIPTRGSENVPPTSKPEANSHLTYSPQDARSGLQKKPDLRQPVSLSTGSPKGRKSGSKKCHESPTKSSKGKQHGTSTVAEVGVAKHRPAVRSEDSGLVEHKFAEDKSRAPGTVDITQQSGVEMSLLESPPVIDQLSEQPLVLPLDIEQGVSSVVAGSSETKNDKATKQLSDKGEKVGAAPGPKLLGTIAPIVAMSPITAMHISPTEASLPKVNDAMAEPSAGIIASPEESAADPEPKDETSIDSVRNPQSGSSSTAPIMVDQIDETPTRADWPLSASAAEKPLHQDTPALCNKTDDMPISPVHNTELNMPMTSQDNVAAPKSNAKQIDRSKPIPSVEVAKKESTSQTESLSPFARPSKSQIKREKEQKKKAQKKEKAGQAEKVKATNIAASSKVVGGLVAKSKVEHPPGDSFSTTKDTELTTGATGQMKEGSGATEKEKVRSISGEKAEVEHDADDFGKQNDDNSSRLSNEIESETPKAIESETGLTGTSEHILCQDSASLSLQASTLGSAIKIDTKTEKKPLSPTAISFEPAAISAEAHVFSPKSKSRVPDIPNFALLDQPQPSAPLHANNVQASSDSHFPSSEISLVDSDGNDSCFTRQAAEVALRQDLCSGNVSQTTDPTSVISRSVPSVLPIQPQIDNPASVAPSPAQDEFHTPLQTPSALITQNEQAPVEKKKKSKASKNNAAARRKKKIAKLQGSNKITEVDASANPSMFSATNEPIHEDEPFSAQMMHVDAVRDGTIVESEDSHHDYARKLMEEYGGDLGWDLEEVSKIEKPSDEDPDSDARRRYDAAQIRVMEIWARESRPHEKMKDLGGFWSKEEMSNRGAI